MMGINLAAGLRALIAAIARSPIVVEPAEAPARDFADWCQRQNADLDVVILDWLCSQAPHSAPH